MNRQESVKESIKKNNLEEIRSYEQFGKVYSEILSKGVRNSQKLQD